MITIKSEINGLENIDKVVSSINKIKVDRGLIEYIKKKVGNVLAEVMNEKLVGGTTNDEFIDTYKERNRFIDTADGFVLMNDAMALPNGTFHQSYPFSIALAFEYGVGVVGARNPKDGHWDYDVKGHGSGGWDYKKYGDVYHTMGYEGLEIYRTLTERVNKNLSYWIEEYMGKGVKHE